MSQLKEIQLTSANLKLENNIVKGGILPNKIAELKRTIAITGETVVDGPLYAHRLTIEGTPVQVKGAVFVQQEIYVNSDVEGDIVFDKAVGSSTSFVSRGKKCNISVFSDVNAKTVTLSNAFVTGSIYADDIILDNCVVIGGVFATQSLRAKNCVVGTFVAPVAELEENLFILLPSAFSNESIKYSANTHLYSLALADLGALYRGVQESIESGKINIDLKKDEMQTNLMDGEQHKTLNSYSVVGKVLATDLIDIDKFQNHFLLTAAALGPQLLKTYDLGIDSNGNPALLTHNKIREFFFNILDGKIKIKDLNGTFSLEDFSQSV